MGGYSDNLIECKTHKLDCCDDEAIDKLFKKEKFDIVIHAACAPYEGLSIVSPLLVTRNTFDATVSILKG